MMLKLEIQKAKTYLEGFNSKGYTIGIETYRGILNINQRGSSHLKSVAEKAREICKWNGGVCSYMVAGGIYSTEEMQHLLEDQDNEIVTVSLKTNLLFKEWPKDPREYYCKTYLEWLMLSNRDTIITSRNNFGVLASIYSWKDTYLIPSPPAGVYIRDKEQIINTTFPFDGTPPSLQRHPKMKSMNK